jgi:hypothetical protein
MLIMDNAHALLVGIAAYENVNPLPPVKDAAEMARLLTSPDQCGYPADNMRLLTDAQATGAALRQELSDLARRTNAGSTVFIYFSGHGGRITTGSAVGEYLLPVDAVYPDDDALARTALSGSEFTEALRAIPARKVVIILDCCHAGGIGQPRDLVTPVVQPGLSDSYYAQVLKAGQGRVIFASSQPTELSYVLGGAEYGLFTQHLLDGLRGGVIGEDGFVRVFDLFEYVQPRVTRAHPRQHPLFKCEVNENFAVALARGGQKGTVPRDTQGFRYDVYVSYVDKGPDSLWVWQTLVPRLEAEGLKVVVSGDVEGGSGVDRVVSSERGIEQSRRVLVVLSEAFLAHRMGAFEEILAQTLGIEEGSYRLLPVKIAPTEETRIPLRLRRLVMRDLTHPARGEREFKNLLRDLKGPLPHRD